MIPSAENPESSLWGEGGAREDDFFFFFNPEEGLGAALLASPAAGCFAFLVAALAAHSTSFFAVAFKHRVTYV